MLFQAGNEQPPPGRRLEDRAEGRARPSGGRWTGASGGSGGVPPDTAAPRL